MDREFGLKELYEVTLKTTYPIEINGKQIEAGEVVARFDKIQIASFKENKDYVTAHGGFNDAPRVLWETTKELPMNFTQGIFSKVQFALMSNSRLISSAAPQSILISKREEVESDENCLIHLEKETCGRPFVYDESFNKIEFEELNSNTLKIAKPYKNCVVDYTYDYNNGATIMLVGQRLINGFLTLEGKTRVKDDITGQVKTGILYIPKLKLMSELSMRLGENATPLVNRLDAVAYPSGPRGNSRVMELYFLENDIDSDM